MLVVPILLSILLLATDVMGKPRNRHRRERRRQPESSTAISTVSSNSFSFWSSSSPHLALKGRKSNKTPNRARWTIPRKSKQKDTRIRTKKLFLTEHSKPTHHRHRRRHHQVNKPSSSLPSSSSSISNHQPNTTARTFVFSPSFENLIKQANTARTEQKLRHKKPKRSTFH